MKNTLPRSFVLKENDMNLARNKAAAHQQITFRNMDVKDKRNACYLLKSLYNEKS